MELAAIATKTSSMPTEQCSYLAPSSMMRFRSITIMIWPSRYCYYHLLIPTFPQRRNQFLLLPDCKSLKGRLELSINFETFWWDKSIWFGRNFLQQSVEGWSRVHLNSFLYFMLNNWQGLAANKFPPWLIFRALSGGHLRSSWFGLGSPRFFPKEVC